MRARPGGRLKSPKDEDRITRSFESLFEFGTIKDCIADGLHLLENPRLQMAAVKRVAKSALDSPDSRP